jgi:hypothetical protein
MTTKVSPIPNEVVPVKAITDQNAVHFIAANGVVAGSYQLRDNFKPHVHPLRTPFGRTVSLSSPHDHKHHKGLMYALRTERVNFWEERSTLPKEEVGKMVQLNFVTKSEESGAALLRGDLLWQSIDSQTKVFREERSIACRYENGAFVWRWTSKLQVLLDCTLIMSQWSDRLLDRSLVNYHGLGLRLVRDFGCTGGNLLILDGETIAFPEGMGSRPKEVTFYGSLDGDWPPACASVTFRQQTNNGLYVRESPFAFLSLGPSNLSPIQLTRDSEIFEDYEVIVRDESGIPPDI